MQFCVYFAVHWLLSIPIVRIIKTNGFFTSYYSLNTGKKKRFDADNRHTFVLGETWLGYDTVKHDR